MKLTKKIVNEVWNAVLKFLNVDDIVIDDTGDLCATEHDSDGEYCHSLYLSIASSTSSYISVDNESANAYKNANWSIDNSMTIDEFAYHLKQKSSDVKYRILVHLLKLLKRGFYIDNCLYQKYKASSLEEIMIKNDLKVR
jgi:hypothetical protein